MIPFSHQRHAYYAAKWYTLQEQLHAFTSKWRKSWCFTPFLHPEYLSIFSSSTCRWTFIITVVQSSDIQWTIRSTLCKKSTDIICPAYSSAWCRVRVAKEKRICSDKGTCILTRGMNRIACSYWRRDEKRGNNPNMHTHTYINLPKRKHI